MRSKIVIMMVTLLALYGIFSYIRSSRVDAYVDQTEWTTGDVLTSAELNGNFTAINAGLDSLDQASPDSFYLNWTNAFGTSLGTNDSLVVSIVDDSPIGDGQAAYIYNAYLVEEQVKLTIDSRIPNDIAMLDSIVIPVWTETIDKTDWVSISVFEDSTHAAWKSAATATDDSSTSTTARTALYQGVTTSIKGGKFRIEMTVETESDSMFIGRPKCFVTNPTP